MKKHNDDYWEFSVWFLGHYGNLILEPYYEEMQLAALHAWLHKSKLSKLKGKDDEGKTKP